MVPDFLKKYESGLKKYELESVAIRPRPIQGDPDRDPLDLSTSKFRGRPFYPMHKEYPRDRLGNPMILLVQLNFNEIPLLEHFPSTGIMQLYASATHWYDDDVQIVFIDGEDLQSNPIQDFSFLDEVHTEELPIPQIYQLTFEETMDRGSSMDARFDYEFDGVAFWDFEEQLSPTQQKQFNELFDSAGHKLGGYGSFCQEDPRDYELGKRNDLLLLQIDSEDGIMFGDAGVAHLFISEFALRSSDFSQAYFHWDCF